MNSKLRTNCIDIGYIIPRDNNFDLIRLFAAFQVVFLHSKGHLHIKNDYLDLFSGYFFGFFPGVPIFFIISGFLIYASLDKNKNNIKQYMKNRILRIYPALWVCIAICASLLLLADNNNEIFSSGYFYLWLIGQGSFFQFYTPDILRFWGVGTPNGSLWTITIELQFYLLLPVLYMLLNRFKSGLWIFSILFGGSIIVNWILGGMVNTNNLYVKLSAMTIFPYLYYFLIGVVLYRNWQKIQQYFLGKFFFWFVGYLMFSLFFSNRLGFDTSSHWVHTPINIVSDMILAGVVLSTAFTNIKLSHKILKGYDISYGMYIYHMLVVNVLVQYDYVGNLFFLILSWIITIILALLSWVFIEKPILKLKYI